MVIFSVFFLTVVNFIVCEGFTFELRKYFYLRRLFFQFYIHVLCNMSFEEVFYFLDIWKFAGLACVT